MMYLIINLAHVSLMYTSDFRVKQGFYLLNIYQCLCRKLAFSETALIYGIIYEMGMFSSAQALLDLDCDLRNIVLEYCLTFMLLVANLAITK